MTSWTYWLLPSFDNCNWSSWTHPCASVCLAVSFPVLWANEYQGVWLLIRMVRPCSVLKDIPPNSLAKWLHHFAFLPVMNESPHFPHVLSASGVNRVFCFGHSNRHIVVSHCWFNLQFPSDIQHFQHNIQQYQYS